MILCFQVLWLHAARDRQHHPFATEVRRLMLALTHGRSRTGVCHNCESGLVSGAVVYGPEPLDKPADGNLLICCSQPVRDVLIETIEPRPLGQLSNAHLVGYGFTEHGFAKLSRGPDVFARI